MRSDIVRVDHLDEGARWGPAVREIQDALAKQRAS